MTATTWIRSFTNASGPSRRARLVAWTLWSVALACVALSVLFIVATISIEIPSRGFGFRGWVPLVAALWVTIGARIASRQPSVSVGWLILAVGMFWAVNALFEEYATYAYFPQELGLPLVPQAVWFDNMVGAVVAGLAAIALLVVPDGRLKSRRWTPLVIAIVIVTLLSIAAFALLPRRLAPFPFDNPFGVEALRVLEPWYGTIYRSLDVARGLEVLIPTAALLLRLRAARGVQREQLKWVAYAATFASVLVFLYAFVDHPLVEYGQIVGLILVPLAFGIAMRRYRLYDIDRILNGTIVLGAATAVVAGLYTASIGLTQRIFIVLTGERSDAAVVLTTLVIAAAFTPIKDWIQAFVKRSFGTSLPGTKGLDAFTSEVDEHLRLSDRERLLGQLLAESVSSTAAVGGALEFADGQPHDGLKPIGAWSGDPHIALEVSVRSGLVARVLLGARHNGEPYDDAIRQRLDRAATVVGLALERIGDRLPLSATSE